MVFILCSIILFCIIIYLMPKRMTSMEMYATAWFALTYVLVVDNFLSIEFDLYGYFPDEYIGWRSLIVLLVYPLYNAIFLNFFPKIRRSQVLYILGHSLILVAYEWTTVQVGAFYYNEWKLIYSVPLYPLILLILYWNLKAIRILKSRE